MEPEQHTSRYVHLVRQVPSQSGANPARMGTLSEDRLAEQVAMDSEEARTLKVLIEVKAHLLDFLPLKDLGIATDVLEIELIHREGHVQLIQSKSTESPITTLVLVRATYCKSLMIEVSTYGLKTKMHVLTIYEIRA